MVTRFGNGPLLVGIRLLLWAAITHLVKVVTFVRRTLIRMTWTNYLIRNIILLVVMSIAAYCNLVLRNLLWHAGVTLTGWHILLLVIFGLIEWPIIFKVLDHLLLLQDFHGCLAQIMLLARCPASWPVLKDEFLATTLAVAHHEVLVLLVAR